MQRRQRLATATLAATAVLGGALMFPTAPVADDLGVDVPPPKSRVRQLEQMQVD